MASLNENHIKAEGCREVFMALPQCTELELLAYARRLHASHEGPALTRRLCAFGVGQTLRQPEGQQHPRGQPRGFHRLLAGVSVAARPRVRRC